MFYGDYKKHAYLEMFKFFAGRYGTKQYKDDVYNRFFPSLGNNEEKKDDNWTMNIEQSRGEMSKGKFNRMKLAWFINAHIQGRLREKYRSEK